mgnify:CR=1 FL=1
MSSYMVMSERLASGFYVRVDDGKIPVSIVINDDKRVHIVVHNAASRAWGGRAGYGKVFPNIEAALESYKSSRVKEALKVAAEFAGIHLIEEQISSPMYSSEVH